jgi:hypothetical protein
MVTRVSRRDWTYAIDFPDDGWVWAPEPHEDVATWAQEVSDDLGAQGEQATTFGDQLRQYAIAYREGDYESGALWIPQVEYGVVATRTTEVVVEGPGESLTLETVAQLERQLDDERLQPSHLSRVELPAGPAVRVRRTELSGHVFGNERLAELVSHVIVPEPALTDDGRRAAVRHVVAWQMLTQGDDLAELADDCAALVTIERDAG